MSTKTTFKRVALVAVAALGLGVLSSVSASAAPSAAYTTMYDTALGTQIVGGNATVTITLDTLTVTNMAISGVGSVVSVSDADSSTVSGCVVALCVGAISWSESSTINNTVNPKVTSAVILTSSTAGTTTISMTPLNSSGTPGTTVTKTVTWVATGASFVDHSTVTLGSSLTVEQSATGEAAADDIVADALGTAAVAIAQISVRSFRVGDTTTVSTLPDANSTAVVATISGAGTIAAAAGAVAATAAATRGAVATYAAAATSGVAGTTLWGSGLGLKAFYIYPDGRTGTGTVTITVGGVVVSTKTVSFYGATTKILEDADSSVTPKTLLGINDTATINVMSADAQDVQAAAFTTLVCTSATTTVATVACTQAGQITVTGVALGTSVITASVGALATATIKKTFTVTVTESSAKKVTMTFDKATYAPGEKMLLTVAATGTTGTKIADGSRTVFTTVPTANVANIGTLPATTAIALVGGEKTYTLYAPLLSGEVVVSGTDNATVPVAITATATVAGGASDAALDAANEATDAAYAAADAADNATQAAVDAGAAAALAQESADAALAAVTDLGIKVTGLLDALSKSLANIYKIIKAIQAKQK